MTGIIEKIPAEIEANGFELKRVRKQKDALHKFIRP